MAEQWTNNIFVGKAGWGYFIDFQPKDRNIFKNIDIVRTKRQALKIGKVKAKELNVPLLTDWD